MSAKKSCPPGCSSGNHKPWCPGVTPNKETHRLCGDEITRLRRERDEAREWVRKLHDHRTLTCVFCGHDYPPGEDNVAALQAHVESCPDHPLATLRAQVDRLRRERDEARAALEEIVRTLGPEPPGCDCAGCEDEIRMALDAAKAALAGEEEE